MNRPMLSTALHVVGATRVTPRMRRITFAGPGLAGFASVAPDQQVKLFFARDGGVPAVPDPGPDGDVARWYRAYLAVPEPERPWMRSYTVRRHLPETGRLEIDFVLHDHEGGAGPATRWAARARPGDTVWMYGPAASRRPAPPPETGWKLLAGDASALPAIGALVESLAAGERALVCAEVADAGEEQKWESAGDVEVRWAHTGGPGLLDTVRSAGLPADAPGYAWLAGEASLVRALRRHLVDERGLDRRTVAFTGYWRRHLTQDDALTEEDEADRTEAMRQD
ncbi:siderophore-interacting protein [Streptomyces sp. NPDC003717]|uniref:siderophore-interacting protein n=1 Tax=Streptomyces sp. NPDC003717 TaxID=3154276 RepID=UPI0033B86E77